MIIISAEIIICGIVLFYVIYLRTQVKLLKHDITKLKEEKDLLSNWIKK